MTKQTSYPAGAFLRSALNTLDDWRHLPAYQLERRVDIFFGLLLPEIIEAEFGLPREDLVVIPELPLHKRSLDLYENDDGTSAKDNKSVKVDFAVFYRGQRKKTLLLVELKTDNKSIDFGQLERMKRAKAADNATKKILTGIFECADNSKHGRKYAQLVWKLKEIGCISVPECYSLMDMKDDRPGLSGHFSKLDVTDISDKWSKADVEMALIYPGGQTNKFPSKFKDSGLRLITFSKVARVVRDNPLTPFLKLWTCCEAGKINPWNG